MVAVCQATPVRLIFAIFLFFSSVVHAQEASEEASAEQRSVRLTKAPKVLESVQADYPQAAIEARVEGPVRMKIVIGPTGLVTEVTVLEDPGFGLGQAAAEAIKKFIFSPGEVNNQPAPISLEFTITFELPILPSEFQGKVVEKSTDKGIEAVGVTIERTDPPPTEADPAPRATTTTDAQGGFSFGNVPPGRYAVRLELDAYREYATQIDLVPGKTSEATYTLEAQPVNLTGRIREAGTRKILPAIAVEVSDPQGSLVRQGFTDAQGIFAFQGLPPGSYTLRLKGQGYIAAEFKESITPDQRTEVDYFIEAQYYDEYTVTTTARRARREVSRQTLKLEEVRRVPGTNGDVVRVVQNLPGVARPSFVSGAVVVRGAAPRDTQVFLEGDNIPLVFHFFGGPAVINSEMIEAIDFYPGNFSARYGRATAGIIDLQTRDPKTDRFHGMAEVDLLDATLLLEGPITDTLSFALSARRSYYDLFLKEFIPEDTVDVVAAPRYYDYQAWLSWRPGKSHMVQLFLYGSNDQVELLLPEGEERGNADFQTQGINLENGFDRAQVRWEWRPDAPVENDFMVSYGVNQSGFEAAENVNFTGDFYQTQLRDELRLTLAPFLSLIVGVDFQFGNVDYAIALPRFSGEDGSRDQSSSGAGDTGRPNFGTQGVLTQSSTPLMYPAFYTEVEIQPVKGLRLIPGLRLDYFSTTGDLAPSPRFVARWQAWKTVTLKGGIGVFNQPPVPGSTEPLFGNPDLTYEKARHYSVGAEWRPRDHLEIDATLFGRTSFDVISNTSEVTIDPNGQARPRIFNNQGEARSYGLELLIRHYPKERFFGWVAYTLSRAERLNLATNEWQIYRFDQTHILTLVAGYNLPFNIDISARYRLVSGNPYTPIVGGAVDTDSDRYLPIYGPPFSDRNPYFSQLDFRADKKFVFDTWILGAYLDIINVTWRDNQEGIRSNYDFTQSAPVLGLPILPTLGVNARW